MAPSLKCFIIVKQFGLNKPLSHISNRKIQCILVNLSYSIEQFILMVHGHFFYFFLSPSWYFRSQLQLDCSSNTLNYDNLGKLQFQSSSSTLVSHGIPESVSTGAVSSELSLRYNYLCWTHHQDTQGLMGQDD